jgi:hypothetical protein
MALDDTISNNKPHLKDSRFKQIGRELYQHALSSTGQLTVATPFYATSEVVVSGMSDKVSCDSRLNAAILTYLGIGYALEVGRNFSQKLFGISSSTSEKLQSRHDSLYFAAISIPYSLGLYAYSGETDVKKLALGTSFAVGISLFSGPALGYAMDIAKDIGEIAVCKREKYLNLTHRLSLGPHMKKLLGLGAVCASVALTGLLYYLTPDTSLSQPKLLPLKSAHEILETQSLQTYEHLHHRNS